MRIFIGIDLDSQVQTQIERFVGGIQGLAPDARWLRPESLHITLKFIGEQTPAQVEAIAERLRSVKARAFDLRVSGYGFFPTAKAPRVFWIGVSPVSELATLAASIDAATSEAGVPREERPYSPHLTLARGGPGRRSGSPKWRPGDTPNAIFEMLQKRLASIKEPNFGTMSAREFILYQSQLSPAGSKYTRLQTFRLSAL
jgi:RNA 2',3'-cyclic 3'-phosphodiesterase